MNTKTDPTPAAVALAASTLDIMEEAAGRGGGVMSAASAGGTKGKVEARNFSMHPKLLMDVMRRQAGSLPKAVLEGVMNAADAKATRCDIVLDAHKLTITDDGTGFTSRAEIERNFEVFGQPHEDSEQKVYGAFRMGRGQLFSFGRNQWRTGTFEMRVDLDKKGLAYELSESLPKAEGCTVTVKLYHPLLPSSLLAYLTDIQRSVQYMSIAVSLNGKVVSTNPTTLKWDHETTEAYIKLKDTGDLFVYNLGALVQPIPIHHFGTGGVVVSKKQVRVNFARNDLDQQCPVWRKIRPFLAKKARAKIERKPALNDGERQRLANLWVQGEIGANVGTLRLFTDVTGRHWTLDSMCKSRVWGKKVTATVAKKGDLKGDRVMQKGSAFVFADDTLERFGVETVEALLKIIRAKAPNFQWRVVSYEKATIELRNDSMFLNEEECTTRELAILDTIRAGNGAFGGERRVIRLGVSDTANGWTDGTSYIVVGRGYLREYLPSTSIRGWQAIARLMLHEYCHDGPDTETHFHSPEFYQSFHDRWEEAAKFLAYAIAYYPVFLSKREAEVSRETKEAAWQADRLERGKRGEKWLIAAEAKQARPS